MVDETFEVLDTEDVLPNQDGKHIRINKSSIKPNYNPNHEHVWQRVEGGEDTEYFYEVKCQVKKCPLGKLIKK